MSNGDVAAVRARSARSFVTVASIAATSLAVPPEIQPSPNRGGAARAPRSESPPRRIGGCGSVAGRGAKCTASKSKWRPWYDGVVSVQSARQHLDALLGAGEAPLRVESERGELLRQPARTHTEHHAPAGQHVERRDRARGDERVPEREHVDRGAELDRRGGRRDGGQHDPRVVQRRVERERERAVGAVRIRAVDPRREHHVVGHEHRPVAGRFGPRRDFRHVLGPDHDQIEAQLHAIPLSPEFS